MEFKQEQMILISKATSVILLNILDTIYLQNVPLEKTDGHT